jgi:PAS domain-containing protein
MSCRAAAVYFFIMDEHAEAQRALAAELLELRKRVATGAQRAYWVAADDEIARSEEKFRRLFETAHDGILILDDTGEITDINPFLLTLLKYDESDIVGKKLWDIGPFHDEHESKVNFEELKKRESLRYDD